MRRNFFFLMCITTLLSVSWSASGQEPVQWSFSAKNISRGVYEVHAKAAIASPWHLYSQNTPKGGPVATVFSFGKSPVITLDGAVVEKGNAIKKHEEVFGVDVIFFNGEVDFVQVVKTKLKTNLTGSVKYMVCNDRECLAPKTVPFEIMLK